MIRNVLRQLNKARYGSPPSKAKAVVDEESAGRARAQTAKVFEFSERTTKELLCEEYFNIGDDILISKNFIVETTVQFVNPLNIIKRVSYVVLSPDQTILHIYFEDYVRVPTVNWRKMVEVLKNSPHQRLALLGAKIEEFKSSLREFERGLEEEYNSSEPEEQMEVDEEKLVEARLKQQAIECPKSGGICVKRDYVRRKGYYVKSVHVTKSLIEMIGWTVDEFMMECVLTKKHPECVMTNYYLENLVQTLECIKHSFLSKEYTSSKENISLLHKSSQIFDARCEVVSVPKTGDFIMRIDIPDTLSFSEENVPSKKEKSRRFTSSEKQFIESLFSLVKNTSTEEDDEDDDETGRNYRQDRICKYRSIDVNRQER